MMCHGNYKLTVSFGFLGTVGYPLKAFIGETAFAAEISVIIECEKSVSVAKLNNI